MSEEATNTQVASGGTAEAAAGGNANAALQTIPPPPQPSPGVPGEGENSRPPEQSHTQVGATTDPTTFVEQKLIEGKVIEALKEIFDPEIPVNIYELGLIYVINVEPDNSVLVKMTLTAPACPVAGSLPGDVERRVNAIPEVKEAKVELVWDPPWTREMMSEAAMLTLGFM
jgi:FeS assembly SUF system protein